MGAPVSVSRTEQIYETVCTKEDRPDLHPPSYCYDYIGYKAPYVTPPPLKLNDYLQAKAARARRQTVEENEAEANILHNLHTIDLYPRQAGMPWYTGIEVVRQSRYWREAQEGYNSLLRAFAEDKIAQNTPDAGKFTVADIARNELRNGEDKSIRYVPLLFPMGNEKRAVLAGEALALSLILDESYEILGDHHDTVFLKSLMPPENNKDLFPKTPLQERVWNTCERMLSCDDIYGNGGQQTIDTLTRYIDHPKPPFKEYQNLGEYNNFRYKDGGMVPTWAMIKLSLGSEVDDADPRLAQFLHLISDQVLGQNDIVSFDKERGHHLVGKFPGFATNNGVNVIKRLLALPSDDAAKAMAYANQLQVERQIDAELELLSSLNLTKEMWQFIDAVLLMAAGNVMASITMSRYGGAAAKLES